MSLDHFDAVLRLWQRKPGIGLNESDSKPGLAAYLARNPGMSFVARTGEEIVGAVLCGHDGRRGYLHHLAVAKGHRRKGLGQRLVARCLAQLGAVGILKCNLFLFADNGEGESFWQHTGWSKRNDLHVMQKMITQSVELRL